ncbi:DNA-binding GntR family transcriptional regulator [Loktanella ponticola]|uniref:DNA-binding GntR family transcriptional regulator n=1 Tax=Yoonia ponticola TaxID=1524255 RepID=A0A7W9BJ58_9RHOB|nr:GntR family transcriptional regulator [Yoonia ponticola]MBB5721527.1 DNA-binding GntR family transcriptional regulator [Yoonia ponticola]
MSNQPKRHIKDVIYDEYLGRIQRGELTHEDRLVDTTVASEFNVSRMPVRDAFMRLAHEGYLASSTRGFTLPELTHRQILEIFELRRLLEPRAAALAAYALTDENLASLEHAVDLSESTIASGDIALLFNASEMIRRTWLSAVPNIELRDTILRYMAQIQAVRMATLHDTASQRTLVSLHRQMLTVFSSRKGVDVELLILRFVLAGEESYLRAHSTRAETAP